MTQRRFSTYAWGVTGYNVLVILWGAVVRATGSGAGCGSHWPTCNGAIIPRPEQIETLIEFSHRVTSGLAGVLVLLLVAWAYRAAVGRFTRRMAVLSLVLVIVEGGIGAALVRFELVGDNASVARAVVIAVHLLNTFLLLGALTLTAWSSREDRAISLRGQPGRLVWALIIALAATMLLSAAGAITALGDTLFPAESLVEGLRADFDPLANFLIRLRIIHPALAILTSLYLLRMAGPLAGTGPRAARVVRFMVGTVAVQLVAGFVNVALLAPVWMQVIHLLLADALWIVLVILTAEVLAVPAEAAALPKQPTASTSAQ
jgi:heme A synthase